MTKAKAIPSSGLVAKESTLQRKKWRTQEKAHNDEAQTVFFTDKEGQTDFKGNPARYTKIEQKGIDPYKMTTCPFCLSYLRLQKFLISDAKGKGINKGRGKCPECGEGLQLKTLVMMATATPEQYAKFCYDYRRSGFWQKKIGEARFPTWKRRLALMKWTQPFWNEYKKLRGDTVDPEQKKREDEIFADYDSAFQDMKV